MTHSVSPGNSSIADLVAALPEKYQPIFGHPEISDGSSRGCEDRLEVILDVVDHLRTALGRPIRVLDLGCAQGYFSFNLAARGAIVHGADFLDRNVAVCRALAEEHGFVAATFECARIEDIVGGLEVGRYDLVLGLSVFHHLIHEHGLEPVVGLIGQIDACIAVGIYELAVREEPLYWGASQPGDPAQLLQRYAFLRVLAHQGTHLSGIARPLYFASSRYWLLGNDFREFLSWRTESHAHAMNSHAGTRRYYFADGVILKQMSLVETTRKKINLAEYENEVGFLRDPPPGVVVPALMHNLQDSRDVWILREQLPGRLLSEMIQDNTPYSYEEIADSIIAQLVALEAAGLYHNDLRCWNLLVNDNGTATFIDYGAVSTSAVDCVWPDDLLLSLLITLRELVQGQIAPPLPVRRPLLDISMLPARYRVAFYTIFNRPRGEWTFRALREAIAQKDDEAGRAGWVWLLRKQEHALLIYERSIRAAEARSVEVETKLGESLSNAHHWYLRANEREEAIDKLNSEIDGLKDTIGELHHLQLSGTSNMHDLRRRLETSGASFTVVREQLDELRMQLDSSLQNAHHWYLRASTAEQNLHDIQASASWRLTRPLRGMSRLVRWPRASLKRILLALVRRVLKRPALARVLNNWVRMAPSVHARIRGAVAADMGIDSVIQPVVEDRPRPGQVVDVTVVAEPIAAAKLSARGHKIYERMLAIRNGESA
ncbi:methyltransferase domain-containing protein [Xanthomonas axonopodis]|uniref:methyltransferase domain-containing protein n=1 Tax=Xanthomonas axonopodis TaxID=53413 RepID=UPI0009972188|nr:methyltransferase domain-containing protein [Xanthomonas axonopodis]OOX23356.1 protein kinase [Xanthomonas axonopodis pv. bauhiniae]